jgi:hypothetical protein
MEAKSLRHGERFISDPLKIEIRQGSTLETAISVLKALDAACGLQTS